VVRLESGPAGKSFRDSEAHCCDVDDEPSVLRGLSRLLETADDSVQTFSSPDEFLNRPAGQSPACLILDLNMPTMTGLELQERLRNGLETLPIVFFGGTARVPDSV
jgi:FixJ family two-component response regulator